MLNTHMNHGMGGREGESGESDDAKYKLDDVLISIWIDIQLGRRWIYDRKFS